MCGTRYLNSNSREDELIIVHYTTDDNIDFDKLFKNKGDVRPYESKIYAYRYVWTIVPGDLVVSVLANQQL